MHFRLGAPNVHDDDDDDDDDYYYANVSLNFYTWLFPLRVSGQF